MLQVSSESQPPARPAGERPVLRLVLNRSPNSNMSSMQDRSRGAFLPAPAPAAAAPPQPATAGKRRLSQMFAEAEDELLAREEALAQREEALAQREAALAQREAYVEDARQVVRDEVTALAAREEALAALEAAAREEAEAREKRVLELDACAQKLHRAMLDVGRREADVLRRELALGDLPMADRAFAVANNTTEEVERAVAERDRAQAWVHLQPSRIPGAGLGVFARHNLNNGQLVTRIHGRVLPLAEARALPFTPHQVESGSWAVRMEEAELAGKDAHEHTSGLGMFVNSADFTDLRPNVRFILMRSNKQRRIAEPPPPPVFYVEATRAIRRGEELLLPTYGFGFWAQKLRKSDALPAAPLP